MTYTRVLKTRMFNLLAIIVRHYSGFRLLSEQYAADSSFINATPL